ncbi:MAG: Re/Si-specific NAD(P)(+) transhydrogenase subunit alpha [Carbonactinosporaceae bacterium]
MRVGVPRETREGERRVALVPEAAARLVDAGLDVAVESGAGRHAYHADEAYREAGASVVQGDVLQDADVVLVVQPPEPDRVRSLREGALLIGLLAPTSEPDPVKAFRDRGVTAFAMEFVPRISRAQAMDALSSQALVAGYRAALVAADRLPKFLPLFMTAAGTIPPASVLVLGAGVAGLQAIATTRRLGAVVEAYDVRSAAAEEVGSLGATFVDLGLEALEGAGGYARETTEDYATRQRELLAPYVAKADALITTAAVPGRPAPLLVTREMVEAMRPGSVVVDLAAEQGGNCELSEPGREFRHGEIVVWGGHNVPSSMPVHASGLYARNVTSLLLLMTGDDGAVVPDFEDEVVAESCVTHGGEIRHKLTREVVEGS